MPINFIYLGDNFIKLPIKINNTYFNENNSKKI